MVSTRRGCLGRRSRAGLRVVAAAGGQVAKIRAVKGAGNLTA